MVVGLGDPIAVPGAFSSNRATYLACSGFPDASESVYSSANMRKLHASSTSLSYAVARLRVMRASRKAIQWRYKPLFGHGFRPAEGPVGRNGALPGPSCAQETAFSCRRRTAGAHDERAVACARYALSAAICVTRAGRITYERRVEYHRPLVSHLARLSPCVHESASSTRLAQFMRAQPKPGANGATSG